MLRKTFLTAILTVSILLGITEVGFVFSMEPGPGEGYATIYVSPASCNFTSPPTTNGTKFTVQARIHNYSQVAGWQVELVWDKSLLNVSKADISYAPDFIFPPDSYPSIPPAIDDFNATHQYFMMTTTTWGAIEYSGIDAGLVQVNFTIMTVPPQGFTYSCKLWFEPDSTWTLDENIEFNDEERIDGYYQISSGAGIPTKIHLDLLPNPTVWGQTVTLQGNLTANEGLPIPSAPVTIKANGSAVVTLTTNSTGWFKATGQVKVAGTFNITAEFTGSPQYFPSSDWEILVVKAKSKIYFIFVPNPVNPGKTCILEGILIDQFSNPIKFATVTLAYSTDYGLTWHPAGTLTTDFYGIFSKTFTAPSLGIYLLRVSYAGSPTHEPSKAEAPLIVH